MKIMVTGAGGMVGSELTRQARGRGWDCAAFVRDELDITDGPLVDTAVAAERPAVVVNAAAFTAVDDAEVYPQAAMSVNAAGAGNIALAAQNNGAAVVHISTDYVFDGAARRPYRPDDPVAPINSYGESKLAGEIEVRKSCMRHCIIRTSWIYSHEGRNFVRTMLRAAASNKDLRVVNDQFGSPTSAADLASALLSVGEVMTRDKDLAGTFHFCNSGSTTWHAFAEAIFELRGGTPPRVAAISTDQFPTLARRPAWSVLDTTAFSARFGISPRPWRQALAETMQRLA